VAIGVTDNVDENQINAVASDPDEANAIFVRDFQDLLDLVGSVALLACGRGKCDV